MVREDGSGYGSEAFADGGSDDERAGEVGLTIGNDSQGRVSVKFLERNQTTGKSLLQLWDRLHDHTACGGGPQGRRALWHLSRFLDENWTGTALDWTGQTDLIFFWFSFFCRCFLFLGIY